MRARRIFAAVLAGGLLTAAQASAQEPAGCDKFKWPVDRERAALSSTNAARLSSGADLPSLSSAVMLKLSAASDAKLPSPPERTPKPDTFAGFTTTKAAPAGLYSISLSQGGWVDVVQNGKYLKPKSFSGVTGCDGIRKVMKFELAAGEAVIQISGAAQDNIALAVLPSAD